jgi:hypothetical protein
MLDERVKRARTEDDVAPYSTFRGYHFEKKITFREQQLFGWTTLLEKKIKGTSSGIVRLNIHVVTYDFLRKKGVLQRFYSPHGRDYDDDYSYLQGMNLLAFEGFTRKQTRLSIKRLIRIIEQSSVLVDTPRIGLLVPSKAIDTSWVKRLTSNLENIHISDDVTNLIPNITPYDFVDFSLSHGYEYHLGSYVDLLKSILKVL